MLSSDQNAREQHVLGGRYRIEAKLGHGGTAQVYRVVDLISEQPVALKKLLVGGEHAGTLRAMFEREYHTLMQLAHPGIVRVFDYGIDADSPYYTMELLEGADARETFQRSAPSIQQTCQLLRDAASALALIHSRRMIHRDVSPRNLWCTPDGRAKLIDFGTLVAMGPQTRIAGTPPFVPPEAVYTQPLDARCDIYGLGALAYFLLTKRNAYPAREIGDLRSLWRHRPARPDALVSELPAALSDLVMSMLSLDARGRPASAAEVFDRLSAIAQLPSEDESHLAQAFLTSPKLIGREQASSLLRKRLSRAIRGRGSVASIVAPAGQGRSRMLASFVVESKLTGATVIAVDATAVGSGPFAVVGALAERLLELMPMTAAAAIDTRGVLAHVSPALARALGEPTPAELSTFERGRKISSALVALFASACKQRRLVIAVDDIHRADSASLGVLGKVSLLANEHRLLLVTTCDASTLERPPPALEQLVQVRNRIELAPFDASETRALLGSLFGPVPGLEEAASWLHDLSQGSPQTCMQYAQYLVDERIARYEGGRWRLPPQLREHGLPPTLRAMFEQRIATLSEDAQMLGLGLALARDESRSSWQPENHVRIEDFALLLENGDSARTFSALDELLRAGMVQQRDSCYVLSQRAIVDALLEGSNDAAKIHAHRRLAELFAQPTYDGRLLWVRHLQRAGDHARARAAMLAFIVKLASAAMDWGAMRLSVSAESTRIALADWEAHGGSPLEGILLRRLLLLICSVYDWSLAAFGDAQIAQLSSDTGLSYWNDTDSTKPALDRVFECLKRAQNAYDQKSQAERGLPPGEALRELASCAFPLSGAFLNTHDVARSRTLPAVLEPLRPLSPLLGLFADACQLAVDRVTGRDFGDRILLGTERLLLATELPEVLRRGGAAVNVHHQAVEDARRGNPRALEHINRITQDSGEDMFIVVHARWLAHAFGGRAAVAERFRKQAEMITEDDVWRRNAFLYAEAQLHALTGELPELQRVAAALLELTKQFEGLRPWSNFAQASVHRLRGELDLAQAALEAGLAQALPGQHRAWTVLAPAHAELLLLRGDAQGAAREAEAICDAAAAQALDRTAVLAANRVRALAESAQGQHEAAQARLLRACELAQELCVGGLPLALLHDADARLALARGDAQACLNALTLFRSALEHADAPSLVNAYEALRQESSRQLVIPDLPAAANFSRVPTTHSSAVDTEVQSRLSIGTERHERARQALGLLLEDSGAAGGHLFLFDASGLFAAASLYANDNDVALIAVAQQCLDAARFDAKTAIVNAGDLSMASMSGMVSVTHGDARVVPVLLCDNVDGRSVFAGVALLVAGDATPRMPRGELIQAISRCLHVAGDSIVMAADE